MSPVAASIYCSPQPAALQIDTPPGSGNFAFKIRRQGNCLSAAACRRACAIATVGKRLVIGGDQLLRRSFLCAFFEVGQDDSRACLSNRFHRCH